MQKRWLSTIMGLTLIWIFWGSGPFGPLPVHAAPELTDQAISDKVKDELAVDTGVSAHRIDVGTKDGIVRLFGSVDNLLAKERAARIAETVKGVRAVVNDITVTPAYLRTDLDILDDVREALAMNSATDLQEVTVTVRDGVVRLSGKVDSWQESRLCEKAAKGVKGVKGVDNAIDVVYRTHRTDAEIRADIDQRLRWDTLVDHALIEVDVNDGNVWLSGTVGSAAEKRLAISDAHVAGIRSVDASELAVGRWARDEDLRQRKYVFKSDDEIQEAVEDALRYDPRIMSFNVTAEVENHVATLRGTVDNFLAKQAAAEDARNTAGVRAVTNRIEVRPEEDFSDQQIKNRVEAALDSNPYLEAGEIRVQVSNGIVTLAGQVDSYFEKSQAGMVAGRATGVVHVSNKLAVEYGILSYEPYAGDRYPYDYDWYRPRPGYLNKSDAELAVDIREELWWSPYVDADDVTVAVDDGEAILTGKVDSWSEYSAANENAYEAGAVAVDNELQVEVDESGR